MFDTRDTHVRQLVFAVHLLLIVIAVPRLANGQSSADLVSIDLTQRSDWTGEVWPADFNRDGVTDVTFLTTPAAGSALAWARGLGNGSFDASQAIATGTGTPIGVGDVNGDGFTDIVTNSHVVPGRGNGTFDAPVGYAGSSNDAPAQVADINGDGHADLVTLATSSGVIRIRLGNGDFTFAAAIVIRVGYEPEGMIVTDLTGDGLPDIANTSKDFATSGLQLHINGGNATFTTMNLPLAQAGGGVSARDMNADGIVDLVVGAGAFHTSRLVWLSGQVSVLLGLGGGAFAAPLTFPTLRGPIRVVIGDFNGDGLPDVATGNQTRIDWLDPVDRPCELFAQLWASVSVLLGRGDGTLGPAASFSMGTGRSFNDPQLLMRRLNTSDLNGDGRIDLLFTGGNGAIVLMKPPAENRPPVVTAGPDTFAGPDFSPVMGSATDPDHDWLTFEWRDEFGRVVGTLPRGCVNGSNYGGTHEFTLTVRDERDGVSSDSMLATFSGPGPGPLPTGFTGENIGNVGAAPGTDSFSGSGFSVSGGGADIWGTADAFRFVYTGVTGDFDVVARVGTVQNLHPWTKAGVMIRERLTPGSRHAFVLATPTAVNGVAFQRREEENGSSIHTAGPAMQAPVWLRLVRQGDEISAYYRVLETEPWLLIGTQTLSGLSSSVYVGMAVTSHVEGTAATARFTSFAVTPAPTEPPPLPIEWQTGDVGTVGIAGDVQFDGSTFTVRGSGADIWGYADAFRFVHVRAAGDGMMIVRVAGLTGPDTWSKAGLMIRQSLTADSVHHYLMASAASGLAYQRRVATGDASLHTGLAGATPVWFRVERTGGTIRLSYSTEPGPPSTWQTIEEAAFPVGEAFVGLAVTSHADGALATGVFDDVSHTFTSSVGWTGADVGAVGIAGSDAFDGTTHTLAASGTDVWGTADAFHFKYQMLPRDGSIVARVASLNAVDPWTKAGVMIRATTDPSSIHGFALLSRDHGVAFQWREQLGGPTHHAAGPTTGAPVWLRLTRKFDTITAEASVDGSTWTTIWSDRLVSIAGGPVLVGLALTSHDNTALATAAFDHVTVTPGP